MTNMTTTVLRLPKNSVCSWRRDAGGLSLKHMGDMVTVGEESFIFEYESKGKSLALLLFDTPATLTWSEQDKASLTALVSFINRNAGHGMAVTCSDVSVGLVRAVLKGQINPGDAIEELKTKCDSYNPETKERVKGGRSVLITPKSIEDMDRVSKCLNCRNDYFIELSLTVSRHSAPRTVKVVDVTYLKSLNLSNNKLVKGIADWDGFVRTKLSRFPNLEYLDLDKNGLGRNACDALAHMLSRDDCGLRALYLRHNNLDNGCVEVLASSLTANTKLKTLALIRNDQITSQGHELLLHLLGKGDTPDSTYNSSYTLTCVDWDTIATCNGRTKEGSAKVLLAINNSFNGRAYMARQKIWYVHYQRAAQFDVGPFLGLEVGVMPHLLDWFGVTKDMKRGIRFKETILKKTPFDSYQKRFNMFYQLVRNWNVATLLGHLSPERARNVELEGQVASMGEEIRALKCEIARLKKENQDLSSGNVASKRKTKRKRAS